MVLINTSAINWSNQITMVCEQSYLKEAINHCFAEQNKFHSCVQSNMLEPLMGVLVFLLVMVVAWEVYGFYDKKKR